MRPECQSCPVRRDGLCASASDAQLQALGTIKHPLWHVPAGGCVFAEGDGSEMVFIIRRGWAAVSVFHENGRRQVLRFAMPGSMVGFETTADGCMPCTVEALTDLTACPIPRQSLMRFCQTAPELTLRMWSLLAAETISDWRLLGGLGTCTATERVARLLVALCQRQRRESGACVDDDSVDEFALPISQTVIADATGLTSVHVCRTLKEMRAAGLLSFTKGRLRVMDWPRLADLAEMTETPAPSSAVLPSPTLQPDRWREGVWRNASTQIQ
ncbi:Crp/Fnr family transcriptional regulator [Azospirillum sp. CT11-132]|uniref:Crp/Fnr family transcriptional regulator n=3 Tax=unclassified Azospirillum TaxID=2630922 RepID=UPI0039A4B83C